jgi:hypothetical protein
MKRFFWVGLVCLLLMSCVKAQETWNLQAGAFADYYRAGATGTNMFGVGGRVGVGIRDNLMLEGEIAYDFGQVFVNSFTQGTNSGVSFINSNVDTLHAFLGPKLTLWHGPIKPFAELKVGFVDYGFGPLASGFTSFSNQVANLRTQSLNAALLPGGGVEGKIVGPVSLRLDVGDEMYFNHGVHNGLKVMLGPTFRF